jgi:long-chain fatty acid transport protein
MVFKKWLIFVAVITMLNGVSLHFSPAMAVGPAASGIAAKADTAETVSLNPAGMTRLDKASWYGNPMVMYTKNTTKISVDGTPEGREIEDDSVAFLPGMYYVRPINDQWSVGIGPNAGSGFGTSYGDQWVGRYILDEWSMFFGGILPSVAYRVNDHLSLGGSLSVNYSSFTMKKSVFNGLGKPDGEFELEADGWAMGFNVGGLYEFTPQTRVGWVYRSALEATNEGEPDFSNLSAERRDLLEQAGALNRNISVDTNQPQAILAGFFHDFNTGWTMTLDLAWIDFSEWNVDNVTIGDTTITKDATDYKDMWAFSMGADYAWRPNWSLRGGFLYVTSALEDEDRTLFTRYDAILAAGFGAKYLFDKQSWLSSLAVDLTYFDFGKGEVDIENASLGNRTGDVSAEYDEHYGIMLGISITR